MTAIKGKSAKLAVLNGTPAVTLPAPTWPVVGELETTWMEDVVRSGKWSWLGAHETAFCKEYADFIGSRYCLALANGTVTLQCALQAVGVEPGDEVIVPGLTWCATAQAALDIGANVVFADIDRETLNLDPKAFEKAITPRTKAVIPVHLYGCMCDMDAIMAIARRHKIKVVEDVAHQHGSQWRGTGAGAIGDAGSFSFQQSKVLTCGEGGAVTTNSEEVYKIVYALKQVGWGPDGKPANRYGHNYRITEMQCVLLRAGLTRLDEQTRLREVNAALLREGLAKLGGPLRAARRDPRITRQAYYAMTLCYDAAQADGLPKEAYQAALAAEKTGVSGTYWPVYQAPLLNLYDRTSPVPYRKGARVQNYRRLRLPNTEAAVRETAIVLTHTRLLGSRQYITQLLGAVDKVNGNLKQVAAWWRKQKKSTR